MSLKEFLVSSSTVFIYFLLDLNINILFRPKFLQPSVNHNFIHTHNSSEEDSEISQTESEEQYNQQADASDDIVHGIGFEESTNNTVTETYDRIATEMWANYQKILQSREKEYDTDFSSNTDNGEYNDE